MASRLALKRYSSPQPAISLDILFQHRTQQFSKCNAYAKAHASSSISSVMRNRASIASALTVEWNTPSVIQPS